MLRKQHNPRSARKNRWQRERPVIAHGPLAFVPHRLHASGAVVAAAGDEAGVAGRVVAGGAGDAAGAVAGVLVAARLAGPEAQEGDLLAFRRLQDLAVLPGRGAHGAPPHVVRRRRERLHGQVLEIQLQLAHGASGEEDAVEERGGGRGRPPSSGRRRPGGGTICVE
jgi:hypothetical protein